MSLGTIPNFWRLDYVYLFMTITLIFIASENMQNLCYVFLNEFLGDDFRISSYSLGTVHTSTDKQLF